MLILNIIADAFYAAVAAVGFAAVSNPSRRAYPSIAVVAALGHSFRYLLLNVGGWNIVPASLAAALLIGIFAVARAPRIACVPETISYPALLPMIPGMYAYRCCQAVWFMIMNNAEDTFMHYVYLFLYNGSTALFVIVAMAVGQQIPTIFFHRIVFSSTKPTLKNKE